MFSAAIAPKRTKLVWTKSLLQYCCRSQARIVSTNVVAPRLWELEAGALPKGMKNSGAKTYWKALFDSLYNGQLWCENMTKGKIEFLVDSKRVY